ncbi:Putative deoxyribonuclease RhsC [Rosistilla ulvae]|uniref:Deoxyribonuclease RhsC n=1 Tax=Rosistilla ulvae TaxID=1930277 RepID=A0A517LWC5_9BACT|nr:RHS repeat-associated core domain-containing protein [Rosistilla ulvae]QDS86922.1 Putative deoxyribonuclease RhsC [Rosistilla ulvae]
MRPARRAVTTAKRRCLLEQLETRHLLAAVPFGQNPLQVLDVNRDGVVAPVDALRIINAINRSGSSAVDPRTEPGNFVDVSGDGAATALDALRVINALNRNTPILAATLPNDSGPIGDPTATLDLLTQDYRIDLGISIGTARDARIALQVGDTGLPVDITDRFADNRASLSIADLDSIFGSPLPDGDHAVTGFLDDHAAFSFVLTVDRTAPAVEIPSLPQDADVSPTIRVVGNQIDANPSDSATLTIDGATRPLIVGADGRFNMPVTETPSSGSKQVLVSFSDQAGNVTEIDRAINIVPSMVVGATGAEGWVAQSAGAIVFGSRDSFVVQADHLIQRGSGTSPRLEFDIEQLSEPTSTLLVSILDPNNVSQSALDTVPDGETIFSLHPGGDADYRLGLVQFDGTRVSIDLTEMQLAQALVRFQSVAAQSSSEALLRVDALRVQTPQESAPRPRPRSSASRLAMPGPAIDLETFAATDELTVHLLSDRLDPQTGQYVATVQVESSSGMSRRPAVVKLPNVPVGVEISNASGTDDNGVPYINLTPAIPETGLGPGQLSLPIEIEIANPNLLLAPLQTEVLIGPANQPPVLPAIAAQTMMPGGVLNLDLGASDPDGDSLTYRLAPVAPAVLPSGSIDARGMLHLAPTPNEIGRYEFEVIASDGASETRRSFVLDVVADPNTDTRVSGTVLDVDGTPIAGMQVDLGQVSVLTDASGRFTLNLGNGTLVSDTLKIRGEIYAGDASYPFIAEKLPLVLDRHPFAGVNNVIGRPIYLPKLDLANGQTIDPLNNTTVTTAAVPDTSVEIVAGTLLNQQGTSFDGTLSITEVPMTLTPAALPPGLQPDIVLTIQPGEMVFTAPAPLTFPNRSGWAPGTLMDLWSINPVTGQFDDVGDMRVSSDGQRIETISGGVRNSSWHFPAPPPTTPRPPETQVTNQDKSCPTSTCVSSSPLQSTASGCPQTTAPTNCTAKVEANSQVELHSGALLETHALVPYTSLGTTRGLTLHYDSETADPRPILHFGYDNAPADIDQRLVGSLSVSRGDFTSQIDGAANGQGVLSGQHYWTLPADGGDITAAIQGDMRDLPSGIYQYQLTQGLLQVSDATASGSTVTLTGEFVHVNAVDSPLGAGWQLAGVHRLIDNPGGTLLLVDGDGTTTRYQETDAAGQYASPPGDFSQIERLADGSYRRTLTDQTVYLFDSAGRMTSVTDRNANVTSLQYDAAGRLLKIVDPTGLETTFTYDANGKVDAIIDPAGRQTLLQYDDAGNLTRITDPDGSTRTFGYDSGHHLIQEIDARGHVEQTFYGFHGRVEKSIRKDGTEMFFEPLQTQILLPVDQTLDPVAPPAAALPADPMARVVDSNGNVTETELNRLGQAVASTDQAGDGSRVQRNADNLIIAQTDARGFTTRFEYDERGNLVMLDRPTAASGPSAPYRLTSGETIAATLNDLPTVDGVAPLDYDVFTIDATAGAELWVSVARSDAASLEAILLSPSGEILQQETFGQFAENLARSGPLTESGNYAILLRDPGVARHDDQPFYLTATVIDGGEDADTVRVVSGETIDGTIDVRGDMDTYSIDVIAGQQLSIAFREQRGWTSDLQVVLFDPDGNELGQATETTGGNLDFPNLASSGRYTVLIRDADGRNSGDYRLTATVIDAAADADTVALTSGRTIQADLDLGDIDTYSIAVDAGEDLLVAFREVDTGFSYLQTMLFDPSGAEVDQVTTSTGGNLRVTDAVTSGIYTLVVRDADGSNTGDYRLTATVIDAAADADTVALTSGRTIQADLDLGDIDTYSIAVDAGDDLLVAFREFSSGFSYLQTMLFDPSGAEVDQVTTSTGGNLRVTDAAIGGIYTLLVRDAAGTNSGDYRLTATVIDSQTDHDNGPLTSGQTVNGRLDQGDIDTYTIAVDAGDDLLVAFREFSSGFSYLQTMLFDPSGAEVDQVTTSTGGNLRVTDAAIGGIYTLLVRDAAGTNSGDYRLTATVIDSQTDHDNGPLTSGQTVNGRLDQGDIDTYTIAVDAGDDLLVAFREFSSGFSYLQTMLFDPSGAEVDQVTTSTGGNLRVTDAAIGGIYTLLVRDAAGTNSGDYRLTATVIDSQTDHDNGPLTSGQTVNGRLDQGDIDTYTIAVDAGDDLLVAFREVSNGFSYLQTMLFDPSGAEVEQVTTAIGGNLRVTDAATSGIYTLVVRDADCTNVGDYRLTATVIDSQTDHDSVPLTSGQTVNGRLDQGDIDTYTISVDAGDDLLVAFREVGNGFSYLQTMLFDPSGAEVEQVTTAIGGNLRVTDAATSGIYTLVVRDADGRNVGDYRLTATVIDSQADHDNVPLTSGQTVNGRLDLGDIDTYTISVDAGNDLLVAFREVDNGFSYLQTMLFDPAGAEVDQVTTSTGGNLRVTDAATSGIYTLVVRDDNGSNTGDYRLTATVIDAAADADSETIVNGEEVTATLGRGDLDTFRFVGQAGDALSIELAEITSSFSYLQAILFAPDGNQVAEVTTSSADSLAVASLPQSGTYTVLVRDADGRSTGDFRIRATRNGGSTAGQRQVADEVVVSLSEASPVDVATETAVQLQEAEPRVVEEGTPLPTLEFFASITEPSPRTIVDSPPEIVSEQVDDSDDLGVRSIDAAGEVDEMQWLVESGGAIFVTIDAPEITLRIRLLDPNGNEIRSVTNFDDDAEGRIAIDATQLNLAGLYTLQIAADDGAAVGVYRVIGTAIDTTTSVQVGSPRRMTYDTTFNQLTSVTDELGRQTLYTLDPATGNTTAIREVVGQIDDAINGQTDDLVTTITYAAHGLIDTIADPLGRVTDYDYNAAGLPTSITFAVGTADAATRRFEYDDRGNQTAIVDENGNRTTMQYDAMNRLTMVIEADPDGAGPLESPVTSFVYDAAGNPVETTDAAGSVTTVVFDSMDRPTVVRDDLGNESTTRYDRFGNIASVTDPNGNTTHFVYDARHRRVATIDPDGGETRFEYDGDNHLIALTDPVGNTTRFDYDGRGRLISETDPLDATTYFTYDPVDNLIRQFDRNGRGTVFQYDDLDRVVTEQWLAAEIEALVGDTTSEDRLKPTLQQTITYAYDKAGNVLSIDDNFSRYDYTYDARDRVTRVDAFLTANVGVQALAAIDTGDSNRLQPSLQHSLIYTYDDVGNVLSVTDGLGAKTTTAYDPLNRPIAMDQSDGGATEKAVDMAFNQIGQYESIKRYADVARTLSVANTRYTYDEINRLTDLDHTDATDGVLAFYDFAYDSSSRITRIGDISGATNYSYDDRDQLTGATRGASDIRGNENYEYDANGNRLDSHLHGANYQTGGANRLLSDGTYTYQYDAEGNMIRRTEDATGDYRTFGFDHRNRLFRVTDFSSGDVIAQEVTYTYDALDRRIARTVDENGDAAGGESTEMFVYDREDVLLDFVDADGSLATEAPELAVRYFHGPGIDQVLSQEIVISAENQWYLTDHLGTTRELIGDDGSLLNRLSYDSFGNLVLETDAAFGTRYQFTGREFDDAVGLHYYRARFYDAKIGRFVSEDPIGFGGGDTNLQRYVGNVVIQLIDPSGLREEKSLLAKCVDFVTNLGRSSIGAAAEQSIANAPETAAGVGAITSGGQCSDDIINGRENSKACRSFNYSIDLSNRSVPNSKEIDLGPASGVVGKQSGTTTRSRTEQGTVYTDSQTGRVSGFITVHPQ